MNTHSKLIRIHLGQRRDIVRLLAILGIRLDSLINIFKYLLLFHGLLLFFCKNNIIFAITHINLKFLHYVQNDFERNLVFWCRLS